MFTSGAYEKRSFRNGQERVLVVNNRDLEEDITAIIKGQHNHYADWMK